MTEIKSVGDGSSLRSIALINPLADFGIDTYTHELACGLAANGHSVDVYTADASRLSVRQLPRNYRRFAVLGSRLPSVLSDSSEAGGPSSAAQSSDVQTRTRRMFAMAPWARRPMLACELTLHLKSFNYDFVWTQWPDMASYRGFWTAAALLKIPIVHTVHNIFPHERGDGDAQVCKRAYGAAKILFVHSNSVRDELAAHFPECASRIRTMAHGIYTHYERLPASRHSMRARLGIPEDAIVLFLPGVQRYKNVAACIKAAASLERQDVFLVIAGRETDAPEDDPLREIRDLVQSARLDARVRLIPGYLDDRAISELFEAGDVLMLPYAKSYGSGLLMLGITFGKYIVATRPGMEEAASRYPRSIMLDSDDPPEIASGISAAVERVIADPTPLVHDAPEFDWRNIAASCMRDIQKLIPG